MSLSVGLLLGSILCAAPEDTWQTVAACRDANVEVRLKVLRRASLATSDWLIIEIENNSGKPLPVDNGSYRIEKEAADLRTGKLDHTGSLASGNHVDLLGEKQDFLPTGVFRNVRQVSDYSAALLGIPPVTGWRIRGQFHISVTLKGGRRVETPERGIPFTFGGKSSPEEAGFVVMRQRLKQLLATPVDRPHHVYILDTHFNVPEVAKAVTRDDLLGALAGRKASFDGRWSLLGQLAKRHTGDARVVAHFRDRLTAGDNLAVEDLTNGAPWDASFGDLVLKRYTAAPDRAYEALRVLGAHWDRAFARPLAELVVEKPGRYSDALDTLAAHRPDWMGDAKLTARVWAAVRSQYPLPAGGVAQLKGEDLEQWARHANRWALAGDPKTLEVLRPALRDRRRVGEEQPPTFGGFGPTYYPPVRVCDHALEAILIVLDGPEKAYEKPTVTPGRPAAESEKEAARVRDRMIAEVEKRLGK